MTMLMAYFLPVGWMKPSSPSAMGRVKVPVASPVTAARLPWNFMSSMWRAGPSV
ncbi:hypothetical protein [Streptomyces sp. NPDC058694]|uniref:hypothetical protein n=1 Tax=Streptomyces sp. NPDC058694 TaxID=3346603 RepID=UPI003668E4DB